MIVSMRRIIERFRLINMFIKHLFEKTGFHEDYDWSAVENLENEENPDKLMRYEHCKWAMDELYKIQPALEDCNIMYLLMFSNDISLKDRDMLMKYQIDRNISQIVRVTKITMQDIDRMLGTLNHSISEMIEDTNFEDRCDWSYVEDFADISDKRELELLDRYTDVMCKFADINDVLSYCERRIIGESVLKRNAQGFYEDEFHEYHSRSEIEFYYFDEQDKKYKWKNNLFFERNDKCSIWDYPDVQLDGLRVRYRE